LAQSLEELERVLKRIERHLDLSRAVLRCLPLVFWSAVLPLLYLVLRFAAPASMGTALGVSMGIALSLWAVLEVERAGRVLERLELFFGSMRASRGLYAGLQVASCIVSLAVMYYAALLGLVSESMWILPALALMAALLMAVDAAFRRRVDPEMCSLIAVPATGYTALSLHPVPGEEMVSVMIVSASMALTAFLYLRRAFRP